MGGGGGRGLNYEKVKLRNGAPEKNHFHVETVQRGETESWKKEMLGKVAKRAEKEKIAGSAYE